jgi:hypothetical protein
MGASGVLGGRLPRVEDGGPGSKCRTEGVAALRTDADICSHDGRGRARSWGEMSGIVGKCRDLSGGRDGRRTVGRYASAWAAPASGAAGAGGREHLSGAEHIKSELAFMISTPSSMMTFRIVC